MEIKILIGFLCVALFAAYVFAVPTLVDVPVQGKVTKDGGLYNGENVYVCINTDYCANVSASDGLFYANVLGVPIEDPHSSSTLTISVNGTAVVNKPFYPAGAPQGNLFVNGLLGVGNPNPLAALDVVGGAIFRGAAALVPGELIYVSSGGGYYEYMKEDGTIVSLAGGTINYGESLWSNISGTTDIYYDSGNVEIGSALRSSNLNVNGTITATTDVCLQSGLCLSTIGEASEEAPTFAGLTGSYNGAITSASLIGYQAANAICNTAYPGSHFCSADEIIKIIANRDISGFSGAGWVANGPPGYTATANDCQGWTSSATTSLGPFWEYDNNGGGMGWLTNCNNNPMPLSCCG